MNKESKYDNTGLYKSLLLGIVLTGTWFISVGPILSVVVIIVFARYLIKNKKNGQLKYVWFSTLFPLLTVPLIFLAPFGAHISFDAGGLKTIFVFFLINVPIGLFFLYKGFKEDFPVYAFTYLPLLFNLVTVYFGIYLISLMLVFKIPPN